MKLFGMELFNFKKEPEFMYDFAQHGLLNTNDFYGLESIVLPPNGDAPLKKEKKKKVIEKPKLSPKEVFKTNALNDRDFVINIKPEYLEEQIALLSDKLNFMGKPPKDKRDKSNSPSFAREYEVGGVTFGRKELESIIERLENRKKIKEFKKIIDKYPHTTSQLIGGVLEANKHLRSQRAEEFVPDFPKEAMNAMNEYKKMCLDICNKKAIFYVLADQKDFQVKNKRRDPILIAQSPFGHFWQILGAWDEEMIFLGDL